jgi:FO synthase
MISFEREWQNLFGERASIDVLGRLGYDHTDRTRAPGMLESVLDKADSGRTVDRQEALSLLSLSEKFLPYLLLASSKLRESGKGRTLTFSKNVFVPLTQLCRNHCGYCTFKYEPGEGELFMTPEQVVDMARNGAKLGCSELLFVTGDKPELKYPVYREALNKMGYDTTADYLIAMGRVALSENIFPHTNLGLATYDELSAFRESNPSMGLMLENISPRLLEKGEAHYRCPDKVPKQRMKTMERAGELRIPWTSGILVGIGETWEERIDSLFAIKELNDEYGHIQEIIIQNFSPKEGIIMEKYPPPEFTDMLKLVSISRLIFGEDMNIQIPPNLNPETYPLFMYAGVNDLGGVSPITIDFVNPESPWPELKRMESLVKDAGFTLRERLPVYPEFIDGEFINEGLLGKVKGFVDERGYVPLQEKDNGGN